MAKGTTTATEPIMTVTIRGGLADRHRLPLNTVLRFLSEFRAVLTSIGREIAESEGRPSDIDFGLEVIGTPSGNAFSKGSLRMQVAITRNTDIGLLAAGEVISTLGALNRQPPKRKQPSSAQNVAAARIVS